MATSITEFEKLVQVDMPSAPHPLVSFAVKRAIIEFCEKSWILSKDISVDIDEIGIDTELHNSIDIAVDSFVDDMKPTAVIKLAIDNTIWDTQYIDIPNDEALRNIGPVFDTNRKQITFVDEYTLRVYNLHASDRTIYVKLAFKPLMAMEDVDDRLYEDWVEPIVAGAKYRLQSSPNKDWTDQSSAALNYRIFRRGIADAMTRLQKNFSNQPHRVEWQVFGGVQ